MPAASDYRTVAAGEWRLVFLPGLWNRDLQEKICNLVDRQPRAKHPQTILLHHADSREESGFYLKVFHGGAGGANCKDIFRESKALRAWRQGMALDEAGFKVPLTIAAGEQRRFRLLRRAFILTRKVDGEPLQKFLHGLMDAAVDKSSLTAKRAGLRRMGSLVRQFHLEGFVHGDMVASNILAARADDGVPVFYLMDNDRTRRYPGWLPQSLWKRNLIQLNRLPLPGITLQDRIRFLHAYLGATRLSKGGRRLARWLERKTRRRRSECDGVDASGNFRKLMSWSPDRYKPRNAKWFG